MPTIPHLRLASQQIAQRRYTTPREVVAALGAIQAQDYAGALWSIGLRLAEPTSETAVVEAIAARQIVRTWPMRGTLHFVAAEDVHWLLALLAPRNIAAMAGRHKQLELDEAILARCGGIFEEALQGGQARTRAEMYALLEEKGVSAAGQRGYHILAWCAQKRILCFGPQGSNEQTFVLLAEWVPPTAAPLPREVALGQIALRYFTGHGPATLLDFAGWTGLAMGEARAGLASVAEQLAQMVVDGQTHWLAAGAQEGGTAAHYLLPGFDEYILGYKARGAVLAAEHSQAIVPGGNGVFRPTMIADGQVVGVWKRTVKRGRVVVELAPFGAVGVDGWRERVAEYGRFLGLEGVMANQNGGEI